MNLIRILSYSYNWLPKEPYNEKSHFVLEHSLRFMLFIAMGLIVVTAIRNTVFAALGYEVAQDAFASMVAMFLMVYFSLIMQRKKRLNKRELDIYADLCKRQGIKAITHDVTKADLAKLLSKK